jgi:hypothetical protein
MADGARGRRKPLLDFSGRFQNDRFSGVAALKKYSPALNAPPSALEAAKVGEEGDQDVRFDALDQLRVDRTQLQVVREVLERGLDSVSCI